MWSKLLINIKNNDSKAIARGISWIENEIVGYKKILENLPTSNTSIIGITGPPGAGKSTLIDSLIKLLVDENKKVAVLCIDPSSPFHHGALLGDRIRMNQWYNNKNVFIRSLAGKNSLGGLSPKAIEISDFLKSCNFDYVIIETIGVGQNEVEIASLADVTIVVLVPEAGDEIQTMKAGLMEIADIFVVNKSDRMGADTFVKNLKSMLMPFSLKVQKVDVVKTIASKNEGIIELYKNIITTIGQNNQTKNKVNLYAEKAYLLIANKKMKNIKKENLKKDIEQLMAENEFNLYQYLKKYK